MTILRPEQFRIVAEAGLGHPGSSVAQAMTRFRDKLYVGTAAPTPQDPEDLARIHCHDPRTGDWVTAFESPMQDLDDHMQARAATLGFESAGLRQTGREFGIRSMIVFQGRSDPHPCLYCGTMSIWGGTILRSEDGRSFEPVASPGIEDDRALSIHALTALDGVLYAAPAGTVSGDHADRNLPPEALVYASDDPATGVWRRANAPGFGDPLNDGIFAMTAAHGHVYAGTISPRRGFQLWRTDGTPGEDDLPRWQRVLNDGAHRFNLNFAVATLCEFKGDLYLGSGITGFGYDVDHDVGPAAAELIRVHPDGSWDLIAGDLRFSPDGLKVPLGAMGPGFSNPYNSVIWACAQHKGTLYLGLHNWEPNAWAMAGQADGMRGGFELWASEDGELWEQVLGEGHGKATSNGVRTLCSTPEGLFIGTIDGTRTIVRQAQRRSGWEPGDVTEGFDVLFGEG